MGEQFVDDMIHQVHGDQLAGPLRLLEDEEGQPVDTGLEPLHGPSPPACFTDFAVEAKYDGQRALAIVDGDEVTLLSRNGADITRDLSGDHRGPSHGSPPAKRDPRR